MAVGVPSRVGGTAPAAAAAPKETVSAPSIKERYATEGSAPAPAKAAPAAAAAKPAAAPATPAKTGPAKAAATAALPAEAKEAQAAVSEALKEVSGATGKAIHIHVHAPVHIHIGASPSKL